MEHFKILPPGLVNCVTGGAETGQALVESKNINAVAFTGSVEVGRSIAVSCARQMKPAIIEAGGSDPMIISQHAPLDVAVPGCVMSAFHLSGQICVSSERFFVHEAIYDEFVQRFVAMTKQLRIGPGLEESEIGPLVSESAREKVIRLIEEAVSNGPDRGLARRGGLYAQQRRGNQRFTQVRGHRRQKSLQKNRQD